METISSLGRNDSGRCPVMSENSCWETKGRSFSEMDAPSTDWLHNDTANGLKKEIFPTGDSSEESSLKVGG
jgi:hypothetical protein